MDLVQAFQQVFDEYPAFRADSLIAKNTTSDPGLRHILTEMLQRMDAAVSELRRELPKVMATTQQELAEMERDLAATRRELADIKKSMADGALARATPKAMEPPSPAKA